MKNIPWLVIGAQFILAYVLLSFIIFTWPTGLIFLGGFLGFFIFCGALIITIDYWTK